MLAGNSERAQAMLRGALQAALRGAPCRDRRGRAHGKDEIGPTRQRATELMTSHTSWLGSSGHRDRRRRRAARAGHLPDRQDLTVRLGIARGRQAGRRGRPYRARSAQSSNDETGTLLRSIGAMTKNLSALVARVKKASVS